MINPVRFGKYSYDTLKRRQQLKTDLGLKGQAPLDLAETVYKGAGYGWANYDTDGKMAPLLETAVGKCNEEQLKAVDKLLFESQVNTPENITRAMEHRALTLREAMLKTKGPCAPEDGEHPLERVKQDLALICYKHLNS